VSGQLKLKRAPTPADQPRADAARLERRAKARAKQARSTR